MNSAEQFRAWLVRHIHQMNELARCPEKIDDVDAYGGRIVRRAGANATLFGHTELYERSRVKQASPSDAKAFLQECLSCIDSKTCQAL